MVELRTEASVGTAHPSGEEADFESEFRQKPGEGPVHLVAETPAFFVNDLLHEAGLIADDGPFQADVEILEWDVEQVRAMKLLESICRGVGRAGVGDAAEIIGGAQHPH